MTTSEKTIEIPLNKSRIIIMLLGALAFVAIGFWFVIAPPTIENSYWGSPVKIAIAGYASILFFGLGALFLIRKLPDNRPGLIITDTGLVDNSSGLSVGQISWCDIESVSVIEIHRQKLIMLNVKNPQHYIDRQTSLFKRKSMALNHKMYGTPISITVNGLKIPFESLLTLITDKLQENRTAA